MSAGERLLFVPHNDRGAVAVVSLTRGMLACTAQDRGPGWEGGQSAAEAARRLLSGDCERGLRLARRPTVQEVLDRAEGRGGLGYEPQPVIVRSVPTASCEDLPPELVKCPVCGFGSHRGGRCLTCGLEGEVWRRVFPPNGAPPADARLGAGAGWDGAAQIDPVAPASRLVEHPAAERYAYALGVARAQLQHLATYGAGERNPEGVIEFAKRSLAAIAKALGEGPGGGS